jgi:hypothetical protein
MLNDEQRWGHLANWQGFTFLPDPLSPEWVQPKLPNASVVKRLGLCERSPFPAALFFTSPYPGKEIVHGSSYVG